MSAVMENSRTVTRRCKLPMGLQFRPWIWCLVFQCLTCLPCIFSSCQGVENTSLAIYPVGTINVLYGEPVEILCESTTSNVTSKDLFFAHRGKTIPSEIVNSTTIRLYIQNHEKGVFAYYCRQAQVTSQCTSRVVVESPPTNVTDFKCTSKNLDILNCTWTAMDTQMFINYSLTFVVERQAVEPCIAKETYEKSKMRYCLWNTTTQPRYRQMEKQYFFNMKTCNFFGCIEQSFVIDHFSIVKPDPPSNLEDVYKTSHSVSLQWSLPNNMVDLLPHGVVHKIEYQIAKIDNTSYFRSVDASSVPKKSKNCSFLLSNLPYAHMQYEVRIYIRPVEAVEDEFWSEFAFKLFYTESDRPSRPPDTVAGAFDYNIFDQKRVLFVYWKQLEEYEEAGANFSYNVSALPEGAKNPITVYPDKNKSLSYVSLDAAPLGAITVSIWSFNEKGKSINSSHLYIPSKSDTEALKVSSFTKLVFENGTYTLSWAGIAKIDNYTLFWCQHNATAICTGRMNFTILDPKKTNHVIDLPRNNKYQFAISANNGTKTSGMAWATCDISGDGIQMYKFPMTLNHGVAGNSSVRITWTMKCTHQESLITGYIIEYCPVLKTSNACDPKFGNELSVNVSDPKQMDILITDLKPYTTYQFSISLNTTIGLKKKIDASTVVTTTEDTPTSPRNVTISDIQHDSLVISWDPPLHKNGVIGKYEIYDTNQKKNLRVLYVPDKDKDNVRRPVKLVGLQGFTNYSLIVNACNIAIQRCSVSGPNDAIFVRTAIGPPSKLPSPETTNKPDTIEWKPPAIPGGTVDHYQIRRIENEDITTAEIVNVTYLSHSVTHCKGGASSVRYQVRAVNLDEDPYHGALADKMSVILPVRKHQGLIEYPGEWSDSTSVSCNTKDGLTMSFFFMGVLAFIGLMCGSIKCYKKYRKMEDLKPVLPHGLGIPEKDISKYAFGAWNPTNKDEKPSSDEMLLLPNIKSTVKPPESKKDNNNCASSDHTDSTALSDTSRGPVERQASTSSDEGSDASLNLEVEAATGDDNNAPQDEEDSSNSDVENSCENSPYFSDKAYKKNPASGYVQPVVNPATGYVQSSAAPLKSPPVPTPAQPASSSYVMAALSSPIFTTGVTQPSVQSNPPPSSGYVRPEEAQATSMVNFPKLGPSPTKMFGPESLPTMPTLPPPAKNCADSSYIQLQSLEALPSHKQPVCNSVPLKPPASSGYVSPGDAVINKHLNNMLSAGHLADESAILDPTMSPDAYCRFSWSTDPANDNLHSLLADSPTIKTSKN